MRHVEHEGYRLHGRFGDGEGGIELVDNGWPHQEMNLTMVEEKPVFGLV
jgi:hypothetical protein